MDELPKFVQYLHGLLYGLFVGDGNGNPALDPRVSQVEVREALERTLAGVAENIALEKNSFLNYIKKDVWPHLAKLLEEFLKQQQEQEMLQQAIQEALKNMPQQPQMPQPPQQGPAQPGNQGQPGQQGAGQKSQSIPQGSRFRMVSRNQERR